MMTTSRPRSSESRGNSLASRRDPFQTLRRHKIKHTYVDNERRKTIQTCTAAAVKRHSSMATRCHDTEMTMKRRLIFKGERVRNTDTGQKITPTGTPATDPNKLKMISTWNKRQVTGGGEKSKHSARWLRRSCHAPKFAAMKKRKKQKL